MSTNWHGRLLAIGLLTGLGLAWHAGRMPLLAQTPTDVAGLKAALERQFDILPLQDGVVLRPRGRAGATRSIEVHSGSVAVDGRVMTGAELRDRLGANADLVIRVSFLSAAEQQALAGVPGVPGAGAGPAPAGAAPTSTAPAVGSRRQGAREGSGARRARGRPRGAGSSA
jgi:hypothetical protein